MKRIMAPACLLVVALIFALARNWAATGFGVSPAQANATIRQRFAFPASACDVRFVSTPRYSFVTFLVEPDDFDARVRA